MSEYLLSIVGIVLIAAIVSAVLPEGKTVKLIKGITKLCCLFVILAPVLNFFLAKIGKEEEGETNFSFFSSQTVIQTDGSFIDYCSTKRIENAERELEKDLESRFFVSIDATLVWRYDSGEEEGATDEENRESRDVFFGGDIAITRVLLTFGDDSLSSDEELSEEIGKYVSEEYGCEVEFI